jgi:hypothetical protein
MYAVVERNRLTISVAEWYNAAWYKAGQFGDHSETHDFEYGHLEIDVHKNGRRYLTGFVIDPRKFIVDYLETRYGKRFKAPKGVCSVSIDSSEHARLFSVDFFKARSFVIDGMEKDLIFPQFCRRKGKLVIQGFEVLSVSSVIKYLAKRFHYTGTTVIREGEWVFDLKTGRRGRIRPGKKRGMGEKETERKGKDLS